MELPLVLRPIYDSLSGTFDNPVVKRYVRITSDLLVMITNRLDLSPPSSEIVWEVSLVLALLLAFSLFALPWQIKALLSVPSAIISPYLSLFFLLIIVPRLFKNQAHAYHQKSSDHSKKLLGVPCLMMALVLTGLVPLKYGVPVTGTISVLLMLLLTNLFQHSPSSADRYLILLLVVTAGCVVAFSLYHYRTIYDFSKCWKNYHEPRVYGRCVEHQHRLDERISEAEMKESEKLAERKEAMLDMDESPARAWLFEMFSTPDISLFSTRTASSKPIWTSTSVLLASFICITSFLIPIVCNYLGSISRQSGQIKYQKGLAAKNAGVFEPPIKAGITTGLLALSNPTIIGFLFTAITMHPLDPYLSVTNVLSVLAGYSSSVYVYKLFLEKGFESIGVSTLLQMQRLITIEQVLKVGKDIEFSFDGYVLMITCLASSLSTFVSCYLFLPAYLAIGFSLLSFIMLKTGKVTVTTAAQTGMRSSVFLQTGVSLPFVVSLAISWAIRSKNQHRTVLFNSKCTDGQSVGEPVYHL